MSPRSAAAWLLLSLTTGCSSETGSETELSSGPPSLTLLAPKDGACIAIGFDVTSRVPLEFDLQNIILRPPGACDAGGTCGHLRVRADGRDNNLGAQSTVDLLLGKLASPYHDGELHSGTGAPNLLRVDVTLVDAQNEAIEDDDGQPLESSLGLVISPNCD